MYSLTTDRQPAIGWATNHLFARLYFDSYTQETAKRKVPPSDALDFAMTGKEIPPRTLTIIEAFICISSVFDVGKRRYTV